MCFIRFPHFIYCITDQIMEKLNTEHTKDIEHTKHPLKKCKIS